MLPPLLPLLLADIFAIFWREKLFLRLAVWFDVWAAILFFRKD
jgi:hypothetical protein